jgi:hypothetical protein
VDASPVLTATVEGGELRTHDPSAPAAPWWGLTKSVLAAGPLALVPDGCALPPPPASNPSQSRGWTLPLKDAS